MVDERNGRRNYRILMGQSVLATCGFELNCERLVLPYFFVALGAPLFYAGLVVPIVLGAMLGSQLLAAPVVHQAHRNGTFVMGALGERSRSRLMFIQSGVSGLIAAAIAWLAERFLPASTSRQAHTELMWTGIALLAVAAVLIVFVREPPKARRSPIAHERSTTRHMLVLGHLKGSFARSFRLGWFRRYLTARGFLLSVELSMPFYAIHAAKLHAKEKTGLNTFLIASSIGLAVSGFVRPFLAALSIRLVLSAAVVLMIVTGVIAVGNVVTGLIAVGLSAALGALAQIQNAVWPLYVMIVLSAATLVFIARLPGTPAAAAGATA